MAQFDKLERVVDEADQELRRVALDVENVPGRSNPSDSSDANTAPQPPIITRARPRLTATAQPSEQLSLRRDLEVLDDLLSAIDDALEGDAQSPTPSDEHASPPLDLTQKNVWLNGDVIKEPQTSSSFDSEGRSDLEGSSMLMDFTNGTLNRVHFVLSPPHF